MAFQYAVIENEVSKEVIFIYQYAFLAELQSRSRVPFPEGTFVNYQGWLALNHSL